MKKVYILTIVKKGHLETVEASHLRGELLDYIKDEEIKNSLWYTGHYHDVVSDTFINIWERPSVPTIMRGGRCYIDGDKWRKMLED